MNQGVNWFSCEGSCHHKLGTQLKHNKMTQSKLILTAWKPHDHETYLAPFAKTFNFLAMNFK